MIPRRLYHIWLSDQPEGELARRCMATWPLLGCEIIHITLENCDRSDVFVREALDAGTIEGRVKANDFLRLKYLYENGGIYLDNDVEVLRGFEGLLQHGCFLGAQDDQYVNMAVLGSVAGNWLLGECLARMRDFRGDGPDSPVALSLGTATSVLRRYGWRGNSLFEKDGVMVHPSSAFYPTHWTERTDRNKSGDAYTIHHWNHSWNQLVSVVIPCYNYGHFLAECIESVLAQTYKDVEIIVVDDGSTDNTREVAARYPVRYFHQQNGGLPAARNAGIGQARGQFIQPLDADDKLAPEAIAESVQLMQSADIVCPGQQEFGSANKFYQRQDSVFTVRDFIEHNRIHCASMFRKKAWADVGGYDETMTDGYEDWDFWVRLLAKGYSVRAINKPLFFYRVHAASMMRSLGPKHASIVAKMRAKYQAMGILEAADAQMVVA